MLIYLYKDLAASETIAGNQIKVTRNGTGVYFIERLCQSGQFELTLPAADPFCEYLSPGYIIGIENQKYGIIRTIEQVTQGNQDYVTVTGVDLKGYLDQRITLYPSEEITAGLQGYDAINNASTETVVKYFIRRNMTEAANPARNLAGLVIAPDQQRGLTNDQYMSRFEPLSDLCVKNLEPQKMGYSMELDAEASTITFDVIEGADRTSEQVENDRVLFDVRLKSLISLGYKLSQEPYRNIFYASLSKGKNEAETMTCMYYRDGDSEASGARRFEQHFDLSINLPDGDAYALMKEYALKNAGDYDAIERLEGSAADKYRYGTDYTLGDFVTVQARGGLFGSKIVKLDTQVTSVTHRWTKSGRVVHEPGFGTGKISKFERLERKIKNGGI